MAFYQLEPFGGSVEDRRHGVSTSMFANSQRGPNAEAFTAEDFMYGSEAQGEQEEAEPTLLEDAVAQSNLIRAAMFGLPPK